jgi:hypothetical protein
MLESLSSGCSGLTTVRVHILSSRATAGTVDCGGILQFHWQLVLDCGASDDDLVVANSRAGSRERKDGIGSPELSAESAAHICWKASCCHGEHELDDSDLDSWLYSDSDSDDEGFDDY